MSGRRAIVHIGAPRTGTTTFQSLLHRHRSALLAAGVLYPALTPASAGAEHINHQHLGEAFDGRRPRAERRELLDALDRQLAASRGDVVILSYEGLASSPRWRRVPARLAAVLERHGYAVEIMITVRPQAGAAQSHYAWRCQFLREARPFRDVFDRDIRHPRLDPAAGLAAWLGWAGGRATAVPLEDARSQAPLASRIAEALGLADRFAGLLSPADLARAENRSLGAVAAEAARRLRAGGLRFPDNGVARQVVDAIDAEVRRRGLDAVRFHGLDAAMLDRAEERYAGPNAAFARRLWGGTWSDRVAPDRIAPITDLGRGEVPSAIEAALTEICSAIGTRFGPQVAPRTAGARLFARLGGP